MKKVIQAAKNQFRALSLRSRYWVRQGSGRGVAALAAFALLSLGMAGFVATQLFQSRAQAESPAQSMVWAVLLALTALIAIVTTSLAAWASSIARDAHKNAPEKQAVEAQITQLNGAEKAKKEQKELLEAIGLSGENSRLARSDREAKSPSRRW